MGHLRLGTLPKTRDWDQVVDLLVGGASADTIASVASRAAHEGLDGAAQDRGMVEALWLLTQLPLAARSEDFLRDLRQCGLDLAEPPSLLELTAAVTAALDDRIQTRGHRTDVGEMAQLAMVETLTAILAARVPTLFGATPTDVRAALSSLATQKQFGALARSFFARFTERYLGYYLSRATSAHVGHASRFQTVEEHTHFNAAIQQHCFETAKIVEIFAGDWFSKHKHLGDISQSTTKGFARVAFKKLNAELYRREGTSRAD